MVTTPKGYVEIRSTVPEHLRDAIYSEITERCGYLRRGLIGEIIREAIQDYIDRKEYERSKLKKNDLVPMIPDRRIKSACRITDEVNTIIPAILEYAQPEQDAPEDDGYFITRVNLMNAIKKVMGFTDDRAAENRITKLISLDFIALCKLPDDSVVYTINMQNCKPNKECIVVSSKNQKSLTKEEEAILNVE